MMKPTYSNSGLRRSSFSPLRAFVQQKYLSGAGFGMAILDTLFSGADFARQYPVAGQVCAENRADDEVSDDTLARYLRRVAAALPGEYGAGSDRHDQHQGRLPCAVGEHGEIADAHNDGGQ